MHNLEPHDLEAHRRKFLIAGTAGFGAREFDEPAIATQPSPTGSAETETREMAQPAPVASGLASGAPEPGPAG